MPSIILKATPESKNYVVWSSIVDAPLGYGTQEELQSGGFRREYTDERFERADRTGSSLMDGGYGWDSEYRNLIVSELGHNTHFYLLNLDNLDSFAAAIYEAHNDREAQQRALDKFCEVIPEEPRT